MAQKNCAACDDLREDAPHFATSGITNTECASLKNNTGLNPSNSNKNCTDIDNMNDCLIGNMESEVDLYDVCDWKTYTKELVGNLWSMFKAINCSMCGLWAKLESLNLDDILRRLAKVECFVQYIGKTQNFAVTEENIVWFNNVEKNPDESPDLALPKITGNAYCGYLTGSIKLPDDFEQRFPSASITTHGILLYEYRIKLSDFQLSRIYSGNLQEAVNGGGIHAHVHVFYNNSSTRPYAAGDTGYASYTVPEGWCYLQIRISSYDDIPSSGKVTLCGVLPVLMNPDEMEC